MKKFLMILLFLTSCSANQEISNREILFNDQMTIDEFKDVISSCDRTRAGKSAPGCGLYLSRVMYPKDVFVSKIHV